MTEGQPLQDGGNCYRRCTDRRRHLASCPVQDGRDSAWVQLDLGWLAAAVTWPEGTPAEKRGIERDWLADGDADASYQVVHDARRLVYVGKYGGLETLHKCNGCRPSKATHGQVCERCWAHLQRALGHGRGSIAWAYEWIIPDKEPGQAQAMSGRISQGKKTPPAAANVATLAVQQDIRESVGHWMQEVTQQFGLGGPKWMAHRLKERRRPGVLEAAWQAWLPQNLAEVKDATSYLSGWLERITTEPSLVEQIWEDADRLLAVVRARAPWQAKAQRFPDLQCPSCDRSALVRYEGDEHLTCRRCKEHVERTQYDWWATVLDFERQEATA